MKIMRKSHLLEVHSWLMVELGVDVQSQFVGMRLGHRHRKTTKASCLCHNESLAEIDNSSETDCHGMRKLLKCRVQA